MVEGLCMCVCNSTRKVYCDIVIYGFGERGGRGLPFSCKVSQSQVDDSTQYHQENIKNWHPLFNQISAADLRMVG